MNLPWRKAEADLEREVQYHLDALADQFERDGMHRDEAMRRARAEFGGAEQLKEQCRDESRWNWLAHLRQDLDFGARMLRKAPVVTAAAVVSLALGIGANTAILAFLDTVMWKPLSLPEPNQLSILLWQSKSRSDVSRSSSGSSYPDGGWRVADFFSERAFESMSDRVANAGEIAAYYGEQEVSANFAGANAVVKERPVSGNFFGMLRVQPHLGRLLLPTDDSPGAPPTVVVTHHFWQQVLGGSPAAAGQVLRINNQAFTIAGVLPRAFPGIRTGDPVDLYTPLSYSSELLKPGSWRARERHDPMTWATQLLARRAPGISNEGLKALLEPAFRASWAVQPKSPASTPELRIEDGSRGVGSLRRSYGTPLYMLLALVGLVLLIACANIANLLLARAEARRKEVAVRVSLGCDRRRLIRQFLTESAMLAGLGGILGLGVAWVTSALLVKLAPVGDARLSAGLDLPALLAAFAIAAVAALVFGIYPAVRSSRVDAAPELKEGGGSAGSSGRSWWTPGKILVGVQVALGVLLITAAIAFTGHLRRIMSAETGFERANLLLFDLRPGESGYREQRLRQFYLDLHEQLRSSPGVNGVGIARTRPMRGGGYWDDVNAAGLDKPLHGAVHHVSAGFLDAMGIRVVAGRGLTGQDVRTGARVAVVSEDLARQLGPSPLRMRVWHNRDQPIEVVGVASRARYHRLTESVNIIYEPIELDSDSATVVVRTAVPPQHAIATVQRVMGELDATLPLVNLASMEQQISTTLWRERMFAWLCGAFGVLALVLCVMGLYGVVSYSATRRTHEIGIRMALGATRGNVLGQVLREGMVLAGAGLAVGLPVALWASSVISKLKLGIDSIPHETYAIAIGALAASAFLAVLLPAVRAAAADPLRSLRRE